jgi:hypothetical protein
MPVFAFGRPKPGEKPEVRLNTENMAPSEAEAHARMIDLPGEEDETPKATAKSE